MSYPAFHLYHTSEFFMADADVDSAYHALCNMFAKGNYIWKYAPTPVPADFPRLVERLSWFVERDGNNDICTIYPDCECTGGEEDWFNAIAPYVKPGSHIDMVGDDGVPWQWYFDGEKCERREGTLSFAQQPLLTGNAETADSEPAIRFDVLVRFSESDPYDDYTTFHFILPHDGPAKDLPRTLPYCIADVMEKAAKAIMAENEDIGRHEAVENAAEQIAARYGGTVAYNVRPFVTITL